VTDGEDLIQRPENVWIQYNDGTTAVLDALLYTGQDADGLFVWEGIDPHPDKAGPRLRFDALPAHTTIKVQRDSRSRRS